MYRTVKNNIFEQRMYPKWERGYIVGEMSEANFLFNNFLIITFKLD